MYCTFLNITLSHESITANKTCHHDSWMAIVPSRLIPTYPRQNVYIYQSPGHPGWGNTDEAKKYGRMPGKIAYKCCIEFTVEFRVEDFDSSRILPRLVKIPTNTKPMWQGRVRTHRYFSCSPREGASVGSISRLCALLMLRTLFSRKQCGKRLIRRGVYPQVWWMTSDIHLKRHEYLEHNLTRARFYNTNLPTRIYHLFLRLCMAICFPHSTAPTSPSNVRFRRYFTEIINGLPHRVLAIMIGVR